MTTSRIAVPSRERVVRLAQACGLVLIALATGTTSSTAAPGAARTGALLIQDEDSNVREITLAGKLGPVLFDIVSSDDQARARPGGDDFLLGETDTCCLVIELAKPGGSQRVRVSRPPSYGAAWTPDGRGFAYTRVLGDPTALDAHPNVLVFRLRVRDPGSEMRLTSARRRTQDSEPTWAAEGRRIVFTRYRGLVDGVLYELDVRTKKERRLTRGRDADWSPTRDALVYTLDNDVWTMDLTSGRRRRLTSAIDSNPIWSPDGRMIAFHRLTSHGDLVDEIRVVAASGGRSRIIARGSFELLDWPR